MSDSRNYRLGSIWIINFDPSVGTEIRKTRPGLIISNTPFNQRRRKVTVLPFTSIKSNNPKLSPAVVPVSPTPENGLSVESLVVCIEPMTFDKARLTRHLGRLESNEFVQVQAIVKQYLAFNQQDYSHNR